MKASFPGFPAAGLQFLRDLKVNNNRDWFQARKDVYEQQLRGPMTELVMLLNDEIEGFAPEMVADPKKAVYRIYRDVRFSADKSPYKTHIAAVFSPRGLEKHSGAGLYFHVSADEILVGGGIYAPGAPELLAVRQHIAQEPEELETILRERGFRSLFKEMTGEKLKRVPKGFVVDHPAAGFLIYKQYLAGARLAPDLAARPKLFPEIVKHFRALTPLLRFLNRPLRSDGRPAVAKRAPRKV